MGINKLRTLPHLPSTWKQSEARVMEKRRARYLKFTFLLESLRSDDGFVYCGICKDVLSDELQIQFDHKNDKPHDGGNPKRCGITCLSWKEIERLVRLGLIQPAHGYCNRAKPTILTKQVESA